MDPFEFVEYDPSLKTRDPRQWELRKSRELSHASRVGHGRRRSKVQAKRDQDQHHLSSLAVQPRSSALDPFLRLAKDISDSDRNLLHDYLTRVPVEFYGTSPNATYSAVRETTFRYLPTSEVVLQWTILLAEMRRITLLALPPSKGAIDRRRQQIYHAMRKQTANPENEIWANDILYGVAFAAMVEYRLGNTELSQVHLSGLLAVWSARQRSLSLCDRTLLTNALAVCTVSPLTSLRGTDSKIALDRLKAMERWHSIRRRRPLRASQWQAPEEVINQRMRSQLNSDSTLKLSLDRSLADKTPAGLRITIAILFMLTTFLWEQGYAEDSQALEFLLKLDRRLLLNLGRSDSVVDIRPAPVSPNGLLYNTTMSIYEEVGAGVDYDKVLVWEVARFVDLLIQLDQSQWLKLKDTMASWILGTLDLEVEVPPLDIACDDNQTDNG